MVTSIAEVRGAFARYQRACEALGLEGSDRLVLTEGSKIYGVAYRVHVRAKDSGGLFRPPAGDDFLGFTKGEAFDRLADRAAVLEDVARAVSS